LKNIFEKIHFIDIISNVYESYIKQQIQSPGRMNGRNMQNCNDEINGNYETVPKTRIKRFLDY
jgi:hypothetical protein